MNKIQIRRGTTTEWTAANPVLASGEPGMDTTTKAFKIGDGITAWNSLPLAGQAALDSRYTPLTGVWTDFVPTLTAGVAVTKTVTYARWVRHGRLITANVLLTITGIGTASNPIVVGLPVAASVAGLTIGSMEYFDGGTAIYAAAAHLSTTATVVGQVHNTGAWLGQAPAFTTANADTVSYAVTYEAAT